VIDLIRAVRVEQPLALPGSAYDVKYKYTLGMKLIDGIFDKELLD
jgi:hypothetical protein